MKTIFSVCLITLLVTLTVYGNIINVPGDQPTIQEGLNAAVYGDTVLVAPGTYYENIIWPQVNGIKLFGSGKGNTIIDGSNQASVIRIDVLNIIDTSTVVRGFTITNGNALPPWPNSEGGGLFIYDSNPIIEDLIVTGNTADDFGGGIFVWLCEPVIRYCVITNNSAAAYGGIDCFMGAPVFDHITVTNNNPGGLYFDTRGYPKILNSIVAYNQLYAVQIQGTSFGTTTIGIGYSDIYGPIQLIGYATYNDLGGIIDQNPLFVDNNNDFHLLENSPCIDAGDPNYPPDPDGTITDMGAFYYDQSVPVEFTSFTAEIVSGKVRLEWLTATETNDKGFEVQKSVTAGKNSTTSWLPIGFVKGNGTSTENHQYHFIDENTEAGVHFYRLKQIDYDGTFEFSEVLEVQSGNIPEQFTLYQNYPNPFNPTTTIKYTVPGLSGNQTLQHVTLDIYDILGNKVRTVVSGEKQPGVYEVEFSAFNDDGSALSSGTYLYRIQSGNFSSVKKMILLR